MPDAITQELSSAYALLAELQTKIDEDADIISLLQQDATDHHTAIDLIAAHRKELDKELRKAKKRIREIEGMWRG